MAVGRFARIALAVSVLAGTVVIQASASVAQDSAALVEEVVPHEVGGNAQVRLDDVTAFDTGGGEAIIQPGTTDAESFSYDSVDADTDRLIGLARPEPAAHPVGAVVQPVTTSTGEPSEGGQTSEPAPAPSEGGSDPAAEGSLPPASVSGDAADVEVVPSADVSGVIGTNIVDVIIDTLTGAVSDPCATQIATTATGAVENPWSGIDLGILDPCSLDEIEVRDPCDPNSIGQTCEQFINGWVDDIWNQCQLLTNCAALLDDVCDAEDTAQTCEDWLTGIPTADAGGCGVVPGDIVSGGTYVEGYGTTTCTKKQKKIKALVCVERKIDDEWVTLEDGCDVKVKFDADQAMAHAKSICAPGTHKYRIWMAGTAVHYGGGRFLGSDTGGDAPITCYPGIVP